MAHIVSTRRLLLGLCLLKRIIRTRSNLRINFVLAAISNCSIKRFFAFQPLSCSLTRFLLSFGFLEGVVDRGSRFSICPGIAISPGIRELMLKYCLG